MQHVLFCILYGILKGNENDFSYHKSSTEVICMILVFKKKKKRLYSLNIFLINFNLNYAFLEMDFSSSILLYYLSSQ